MEVSSSPSNLADDYAIWPNIVDVFSWVLSWRHPVFSSNPGLGSWDNYQVAIGYVRIDTILEGYLVCVSFIIKLLGIEFFYHVQGWAGIDSLAVKISVSRFKALLYDLLGRLHVGPMIRDWPFSR